MNAWSEMADPGKILVAGDWHGNTRWAEDVIWKSRKLLEGESLKVILQLGDFGFWSGAVGDEYLLRLQADLQLADAWLMVVPGNHEDYDLIESWREPGYPELATFCPLVSGERLRRILILPRGHRWTWHERKWLACGGAASPDREWRLARLAQYGEKMWWPGEDITQADVDRCAHGGLTDVLVAHDRPADAILALPPWNRMWALTDELRCKISRERLQEVCDRTRPQHVLHGHYHMPFSCELHHMDHGPVAVSQLSMDGRDDNYRVLDIRTMQWE